MSKDTKKDIIEKAFYLFKEQGYDKVTINQICDECKITKTTFYRYLDSKEDILAYFFSSIDNELGELAISLASTNNHFEQIILIFSLIIDKMYFFGKELYGNLYISSLRNNNGSFDEIPSLKRLTTIMIEKAQDSGQILNKNKAEDLYQISSTILFGCGIKWCLGLIEDPKKELIYSLSALYDVENEYLPKKA